MGKNGVEGRIQQGKEKEVFDLAQRTIIAARFSSDSLNIQILSNRPATAVFPNNRFDEGIPLVCMRLSERE